MAPLSLYEITLKYVALYDVTRVPPFLKQEVHRVFPKKRLLLSNYNEHSSTATNVSCVWCPRGCMTKQQREKYGTDMLPKYALTKKQENIHNARCEMATCYIKHSRRLAEKARAAGIGFRDLQGLLPPTQNNVTH